MQIREVQQGDGKALARLLNTLDSETRFMMLEPGERDASAEEQENHIADFSCSTSKTMLIACNNNTQEIAGFVVGVGGNFNRNRHSLYCVIGVQQKFSGQGLGRRLMESLELWSRSHHFHRLELTVMEHNIRAIKLYRTCGFEVEGLKRDSLLVNDNYVNELYMSKLLRS